MKTREQMVFSRSAASRIVQALLQNVEVQVWSQVIWVKVKGRKPKFISPKAFIEDFHQTRMRHAKNLDYRAISDTKYVVINPENGHKYLVDLHPDKLTCTCEDYAQQSQVFEQPCCKHCYRILFALGYQNLVEYVEQSKINHGAL